MIKVPQEHPRWYLILVIGFFVSLVVCILILAAITSDTFFWVVAVAIDLVVIAIGVRTILKMFRPVIITEKMDDVLEYPKEIETKTINQNSDGALNE